MTDESKRYLAIVQLKSDSTLQRIANNVPKIKTIIERHSSGEMEQAFRSNDGQLFGFFYKSRLPGDMFRAEFEKSDGTITGDSLLVLEAGPLTTAQGFSRAWTWLQRH